MNTVNTKYIAYVIALLSFVLAIFSEIIGMMFNHNQFKIPWLVSILIGILLIIVIKRIAGDNINSGLEHGLMAYSLMFISESIIVVLANSGSVLYLVSSNKNNLVMALLINIIRAIVISSFLLYFLRKFKKLEKDKIPILYNIAIITMVIWFIRNLLFTLIHGIYISYYSMVIAAVVTGLIELLIKYALIRVIFKALKIKICKINVKSVSNFTGYYLVFSSVFFLNRPFFELFNYIKVSPNNHIMLGYTVPSIITGFIMLITGFVLISKERNKKFKYIS